MITDAERTALFDAVTIRINVEQFTRIGDIENAVANLNSAIDRKLGRKILYTGDLLQGTLSASGYNPSSEVSEYYYRLTQPSIIVLPCGDKRSIQVDIDDAYVLKIRTGSTSTSLNHDSGFLPNGAVYEIPAGDNYYCVTIAKSPSGSISLGQLLYGTDTKLKIWYDDDYNALSATAEQQRILSAAKLKMLQSWEQTLDNYFVMGHTSDTHGDYIRTKQYLDICNMIGVDVACVSGDVAAYKPSSGVTWFHDLVNNSRVFVSVCAGNHDVYNDNYDDGDIYDYFFAPIAEKIQNTTGETWYYHDFSAKKIRLISINLYQYGGASRWYTHFTSEQLAFVVDALETVPEDYGVILLYHSPQGAMTPAENYTEFYQTEHPAWSSWHNSVSGGVPLYDIVDAFIARTTLTKTYTQTGTPSSITVECDFSAVPSTCEFIAHVTGHVHMDLITYLSGTTQKQLMLNVTCGISAYGGASYRYLANANDIPRNNTDASQDAFNVYVIDRDNGVVKVVRFGSNRKYNNETRQYMEIPYKEQITNSEE